MLDLYSGLLSKKVLASKINNLILLAKDEGSQQKGIFMSDETTPATPVAPAPETTEAKPAEATPTAPVSA